MTKKDTKKTKPAVKGQAVPGIKVGVLDVPLTLAQYREYRFKKLEKRGKRKLRDIMKSPLSQTLKELVGEKKAMKLFKDFSKKMFGKGKKVDRKWKSILTDVNTGNLALIKQESLLKGYLRHYLRRLSSALRDKVSAIIKSRENLMDAHFGKGKDVGIFYTQIAPNAIVNIQKASREVSPRFIKSIPKHVENALKLYDTYELRKSLLTTPEAWAEDGALKLSHPIVKKYLEKVNKMIKEYASDEVERVKIMAGKGEVLTTGYLEGLANPESAASVVRTEKWVTEHVIPRLKTSGSAYITVIGNTSVEGYKSVNDQVSRDRVDAKKKVILRALKKLLGKDWANYRNKVHFKVEHQQIEPKLTTHDISQADKRALNLNKNIAIIRNGLKELDIGLLADPIIKLLYNPDQFGKAMEKINQIQPAAKRLHAIIVIFAKTNAQSARAILREYNKYQEMSVQTPDEAALWLNTKAKYLKNNPTLRRYLHKYVGRSRSTEVAVNHPKQKEVDDQLLSMWDIMNGRKPKPKRGETAKMYAKYEKYMDGKLNQLFQKFKNTLRDYEVNIKGFSVIVKNPGKSKIQAEFRLNKKGDTYVAYDDKGNKKGKYTFSQISSGEADYLFT